jgi:hypothetical protein
MRLPRLRFTVRGMMVAVAVMSIAFLLWSARLNRRAAYCRNEAEWSAHEQWRFGQNRDVQLRDANCAADPAIGAILRYDAERYRKGIIWHARRDRDFRRAMWRPWEPSPNYPRDPPWPPTPANLFPPGVDPNDFWFTPDGRWGTRSQRGSAITPSDVSQDGRMEIPD